MSDSDVFTYFPFATREFYSRLNELRPAWNDQAAKDIHSLYLGPLQSAEHQMSGALEDQGEALAEVSSRLAEVEQQQVQARTCEEALHKHLKYAHDQYAHTERIIEQFARTEKLVLEQLHTVQELVDQANAQC